MFHFHKSLFLDTVFDLRTVHAIISTVNILWVAYTSVPRQSHKFNFVANIDSYFE